MYRISLALNLLGIAILALLFWQLQGLYADYRYHRSLNQGTSQASSVAVDNHTDTIVLLGDSRISGWQPLPEWPGHHVVNAGIGGESTAEIARRIDTDVLRLKPRIVLVQAGMNDLSAAATHRIQHAAAIRNQVIDNIESIVEQLVAHNITVILTPVLPAQPLNPLRRLFWSTDLHGYVRSTNQQLQALAIEKGASWLAIDESIIDAKGQPLAAYYKDTLHLNPAGYQLINRQLLKQLQQISPG